MISGTRPRLALTFTPRLAAVTVLVLGLSTNTHLDAATHWSVPTEQLASYSAPQSQSISDFKKTYQATQDVDFSHVLSTNDALLYKTAFAAQERSDWKAADAAIAQIKDKRLMGHVLADRYERKPPTIQEAQQWLASYSNLPEADAVYAQARHLAGGAKAPLAHPVIQVSWTRSSGFGSSAGFHIPGESANTIKKVHIDNKITSALRNGDPITAREMLTTEIQRGVLSLSDASEIMAHISSAFFYQGQIERARPMAHLAASTGVPLGLWIDGLCSWKQHDYVFASRSFAALAQAPGLSPWDKSAAAFWAYRAAKKNGDETQARHWLTEAQKVPHSFYGALAMSTAGDRGAKTWKMPELTNRDIAALKDQPAGWQALALIQVNQNELAENELRRLNLTGRELQTAALALSEKVHMPALTLQLGGVATNDNGQLYEAAQYPLPPWQPSGGYKVDRALMFALIKHESQFEPAAVSASGACGLMQIMPATARLIANDNASRSHCSNGLFDPVTNIELGQKYVRVLAGEPIIGDNLLFLLTAYNGGPGNLTHWLDGDDRKDPLLFVESLPMRETRDYVQQVMMQYWMYRSRLAEPENSAAQLARGEWPRYALRDTGLIHAENVSLEMASNGPVRASAAR